MCPYPQLDACGIKTALDRVKGKYVEPTTIADFFRQAASGPGRVSSPVFAQELAKTFYDAQAKRYDADYNLNEPFSEADARFLRTRVIRAIGAWNAANSSVDKDFNSNMPFVC